MDQSDFWIIHDAAYDCLTEVGGDPMELVEPVRTVALILVGQGAIDNGGLKYFFENEWPDRVVYSDFVDAYARIGHVEGAETIRHAASSFGVPNPENHIELRRSFMQANYDGDTYCVRGWDNSLCGDERVYSLLVDWVRLNNSGYFELE